MHTPSLFLKCHPRRKDGKEHRYWSLCENRRTHEGQRFQRQNGLQLIDVRQPAQPAVRSVYRRASAARAIAVSEPYVFLAAGYQGLQVLEVGEGGEPQWLTSYSTSSPAQNVAVSWQPNAGWQLEWAESLTSPDWTLVPGSAMTNRVSLPAGLPKAFFRLGKP